MLRRPSEVSARPAAELVAEAASAGDAWALVMLENPLETSGLSEGAATRQGWGAERKQECVKRVDMGTNRLEDTFRGGCKWKGWMRL